MPSTRGWAGRDARIVGGDSAELGEFPFQVSLTYNDKFACGGSILSAFIILTAAHCVTNRKPRDFKVVAGQHNRSVSSSFTQVRSADKIFIHEDFLADEDGLLLFDIALISLTEPLWFNANVKKIRLPRPSETFRDYVTVVGWGSTKIIGIIDRKTSSSDILRKVRMPTVPIEECARRYRKVNLVVTQEMMCAGEAGLDACDGDSGGAAICQRSNGEKVVCGVVSFGYGCGLPGYPGVYTRVSSFVDWIKTTPTASEKCRTDYFYCSRTKECIPRWVLNCDQVASCAGQGSPSTKIARRCDFNKQCTPNQFRCTNGKCIDKDFRCDMDDDCGEGDWSDEYKCPPSNNHNCPSGQFQCGLRGRCIPYTWKCDGHLDCDNLEEELNCPSPTSPLENITMVDVVQTAPTQILCAPNQFMCSQGNCTSRALRCNGIKDCPSGEDEFGCKVSREPEPSGQSRFWKINRFLRTFLLFG